MLMSPDLFLDCILYLINDNTDRPRLLVQELITLFETDARVNTTIDNEVTRFYIRLLKMILETKVNKNNPDELRLILLKFKSDPIVGTRNDIYQLLYETFLSTDAIAMDKLEQLAARLHNTTLWHKCNRVTRMMFATLARASEMVNPAHQEAELRKVLANAVEITTASTDATPASNRSMVDRVDFSDRASMQDALKKHKDLAVNGVLRTGLQGLNRACGKRGGFARGESAIFYALPHNYKSGILNSIAGQVPMYNLAPKTTDNKKPLILIESVENEAYQNYVWMVRHTYQTTFMRSSDGLTDDEIIDWSQEVFSRNGFSVIIERHMPFSFNFQAFVDRIAFYENSGYEVIMTVVDYVNLMAKDLSGQRTEGGNYLAVQALFSAMCNYTKNKAITFLSAHPLTRKAAEVKASGQLNVVKKFDSSMIAASFDVAREVDLEFYMQIEQNFTSGVYYLTVRRDKHRYVDDTPDLHKYFAYRFTEWGIRDDLGRSPEFVQDIYADIPHIDDSRQTPSQPNELELHTVVF